ncbi:MAG: DUF3291 domain-containing protein [Rhodospirillaceae bacterium]|nr:DUF3291 domain-containing protein [Rhodospirillaceae bacterium]MBT5082055.1 DUF3291 domain-containing protein [Rhodospirillaceae bacterium]MBT5524737.1 DUF3291 domain-containing protein [Rhodospirillaceae bacterium]MBT5881222.1 DUF3291 domain-containing protein [Rhodospirillaceae bacterium]MBT6587361.1 DUF3291 domain-containing protein [Rhodospirillaceae bacterium]
MPTEMHLAQLNVGTARYDLDDPRMAGFMDRLDEINALADAAPGFVWRLQSDAGNATDIKTTDDPLFILNLSVWQSIKELGDFAYGSAHQPIMAQRRQWFEPPIEAYLTLWWIPAGTVPTPEEALVRLAHLNQHGPTAQAFTFKTTFEPS